jgi:hypothetical protein
MVLADTMAIFLVIVGLLICFNAVWLFCRAIWEPLVRHARDAHDDGMVKSFFVGVPLTAIVVVTFFALANDKQGPWGLVAFILLGVYILFASIGVSGLAGLIGDKLADRSHSQPPWKETVRGGAVLVLSFLFPVVGWFVLMPIAFVVGCGASIRAVFREWKNSRAIASVAREPAGDNARSETAVDSSDFNKER